MAQRKRPTKTTHKALSQAERGQSKRKPRRRGGSSARFDDMNEFQLEGKDPRRHYVFANPGGFGRFSVSWYARQGYVAEQLQAGGVRPEACLSGKELDTGKPIVINDYVLMSIARWDDDAPNDLAAIEEYGSHGGTGQAYLDVIEERLTHGQVDDLDPLSSVPDGIRVENEITHLEGHH